VSIEEPVLARPESTKPQAAAPPAGDAKPASPEKAPSRPVRTQAPGTGPSFLHALDSDERLAPNQRAALRGVYLQFVPDAPPRAADSPRIPADEALDLDPALGRGQREAVRTLLDRFLRKTVR
jgi:hypothetical protein